MVARSTTVRLDLDNSPYIRGLVGASAATSAFVRNLDSADSRMANLVQTSLALGPALIPIGASAVPAIAGLTTALAGAAGGAAVAVLAFQGVGDALKAVNVYALDPSIENLDKMRLSMDQLAPAGRDFVRYLQSLRPEIQGLQDIAQEGMFPGLQEGLDELLLTMPQAEEFVANFSTTLGDLLADAGDRLNDPFWAEFFEYTATEGPAAMEALFRSLGNVAEGLAGVVEAADPLSDDFLSGLTDATEDFARWGRELGDTEGFASFVDYLRENGPKAADTLGALGGPSQRSSKRPHLSGPSPFL